MWYHSHAGSKVQHGLIQEAGAISERLPRERECGGGWIGVWGQQVQTILQDGYTTRSDCIAPGTIFNIL